MTQFQFRRMHTASIDEKCFALGQVVGRLNHLAMLDAFLIRNSAASNDIIFVGEAALAGITGDRAA